MYLTFSVGKYHQLRGLKQRSFSVTMSNNDHWFNGSISFRVFLIFTRVSQNVLRMKQKKLFSSEAVLWRGVLQYWHHNVAMTFRAVAFILCRWSQGYRKWYRLMLFLWFLFGRTVTSQSDFCKRKKIESFREPSLANRFF